MAFQCQILEAVNTSWALVFCIGTHVYTISKDIGINKEKEICLSNKEFINGNRGKKTLA